MKKTISAIVSAIILVTPLVLIFLPADFFDYGKAICPSKSLLNMECLGCGITRAIQHLIHFDFKIAWDYNKLSYIVLPVLIFLWIKEIVKTKKKISLLQKEKK